MDEKLLLGSFVASETGAVDVLVDSGSAFSADVDDEGLMANITLEEALERTLPKKGRNGERQSRTVFSIGRFHAWVVFMCGLGWLADNAWLQVVSVCMLSVQRQFSIPDGYKMSMPGVAMMLGGVVGASFWGYVSDSRGRIYAFNATLVFSGIMGVVAAASNSFGLYVSALLLVGFGVGGNLPVDGAMFCEFLPSSVRGRLMVSLSVFWSLGGFFVALIAWAFIPRHICPPLGPCTDANNYGWRIVIASMSLYCFLVLLTRRGTPESPAYLLSKRNMSAAKKCVQTIARRNGCSSDPLRGAELVVPRQRRQSEATSSSLWESARSLCRGPNMGKTTALVWGIYVFLNYGFTQFNMFLPKLLQGKGIHGEVYADMLIYAAAGIPGVAVGASLVENPVLGRKWTIVMGCFGTMVGMVCFYLVSSRVGAVVSTCLVSFASQIGYAALYCYTPEVYPTPLRAFATGAASSMGRAASVAATILVGVFFSVFAKDTALVVTSVLSFATLAAASICGALLPIRTIGKSL